jgi:hypothetical protein
MAIRLLYCGFNFGDSFVIAIEDGKALQCFLRGERKRPVHRAVQLLTNTRNLFAMDPI